MHDSSEYHTAKLTEALYTKLNEVNGNSIVI